MTALRTIRRPAWLPQRGRPRQPKMSPGLFFTLFLISLGFVVILSRVGRRPKEEA